MKIIHLSFLVLLFFTIPGFSSGQNVKENELVVIQGEKFILHQVRTGETIYSITRDFKIDSSQLLKYNPNISSGLNIGEILKVPFNENVLLSNLPTFKKGDPTGFVNHTIESRGETAYSISRQYGITVEEVYAYNPSVNSLKKGMTLRIPQWELRPEPEVVEPAVQENNQNVSQSDFLEHTVVSGETIYGITKKYNVSENDLLAVNPELKNGLRAGAKIQIPGLQKIHENVKDNQEIEPVRAESQEVATAVTSSEKLPVDCQPKPKSGTTGTTTLALFLPLFLEQNEQLNKEIVARKMDTLENVETEIGLSVDTIIEQEKPVHVFKQFYGNSENFLQFYEGVLVAVDSMQKAGMKVVLNVFDTKDNPASIRKIINNESFLSTDLIIGPVYENVQKEVAQIAETNHIPIVSPFTPKSGLINNNPQFYQINPSREYLAEATAEMVANDYSKTNFIVVKTSAYEGTPEGQLVELIRKRLADSGNSNEGRFTVYDFRKERSSGLSKLLLPEKENVVFIPTSDEGELSVAISNINNLARDFPITLVGASNYQQKYPSIEITHYHNLLFKYINPYWIDYKNGSTINYIEKFIANFGTEPNSYGIQGFDVAWYFLNALQFYGKDFEDCLPYMNTLLLQGNYYFKRVSPSGGFMNEGVSVISYNRNFEVERKGVIGKPSHSTF